VEVAEHAGDVASGEVARLADIGVKVALLAEGLLVRLRHRLGRHKGHPAIGRHGIRVGRALGHA